MAINTTLTIPDVVKEAYSASILMGFAPSTYYRPFCNEGEVKDNAPTRGSKIVWTKFGQLAPATTPLSESADPTSITLTETQAEAELLEYGALVQRTQKLDLTSFTSPGQASMLAVGANMGNTIDAVIESVALAGTNVLYAGAATSRITVAAGHKITSGIIREAVARLRAKSVPGVGDRMEQDGRVVAGMGSHYIGIIHPHVAMDLRSETGAGGWRAPKEYADPTGIYQGEIGMYEGVRWIEKPGNGPIVTGAGAAGIDVYRTLIFGYQYLGEGVGLEPEAVLSGPFDALQRIMNVGWKSLVGYARVREESGYRIESAASLTA